MAYLFILPLLLFLFTFKYYTFITAIIRSFFEWNGANLNEFIGFSNYAELFKDKNFYNSLTNTGILALTGVIKTMTFPLIAAILVFSCRNKKVGNFFKISYIVPMVVPSVVVYMMWKWIYSYDTGAINQALRAMGLDEMAKAWLGTTNTALGAIILIGFPFIGFPWLHGLQFLVYLAGLLNIPADVFESAELDGTKWYQNIWYIELPMLVKQMKVLIMLALINYIQMFENILILTGGGPGKSTMVPALYMYEQAFTYNNFGYASAVGVVLFTIIMVLTVFNYKFVGRSDSE